MPAKVVLLLLLAGGLGLLPLLCSLRIILYRDEDGQPALVVARCATNSDIRN